MPDGLDDASRRAMFRGSLELMVLSVLAGGPQHGYGIGRQLQQATGQTAGPGVLYPLLHRMAADGLIDDDPQTVRGRERRTWTLTDPGRRALRARAAEWQAQVARMQGLVLPSLRQVTRHRPG